MEINFSSADGSNSGLVKSLPMVLKLKNSLDDFTLEGKGNLNVKCSHTGENNFNLSGLVLIKNGERLAFSEFIELDNINLEI
ncbi:MAG: hypothetical protein QW210_03580 [Candidatus Woesearchaeota archaeon]